MQYFIGTLLYDNVKFMQKLKYDATINEENVAIDMQ